MIAQTAPEHEPKVQPLLELIRVGKQFGGLQAVSEVSLQVRAGSIQAVIGPNGAGKSTLFNLIAGALRLDAGQMYVAGEAIHGKKPYQIASLGIARTFQNIRLFQGMTALECVMVGRQVRSKAGFVAGMLRAPWTWTEEKNIRRKAMELLDLLQIADCAHVQASTLAFGQQRAVEMARALAAEPRLLLLDEPAAGLNTYETAELGRLLRQIQRMDITLLLVEHDMSLVMEVCERVLVLNAGRVLAEGAPAQIQHNREVIAVYLGEEHEPAL